MPQSNHLILVTQSQSIATQVKDLIAGFPGTPYNLEWAFNAANLNHLLHSQDIALILLDQANSHLTEFMMVLNHHPKGDDLPILLLKQDDSYTPINGVNITQHLNLLKTTSQKLHQTIRAIARTPQANQQNLNETTDSEETADTTWQQVSILEFFTESLAHIQTGAETKNITIFTTYDDGLYNMVVNSDKLSFVTKTLLNNALDQTPENGSVGLEVVGDRKHETLHITVWDTGNGLINEHILETASPDKRNALSSAVNAVYEQEGTISTRGIPDRGSSITVSIPWLTFVPLEKEDTHPKPATRSQHIMVVEDNPINAETVSNYLNMHGFGVLHVENGQEALNKIGTFRPDLVLMDIHMPVMDGLEATRQIRAHADPQIAQIPIIALTALAMSSDRKDCLNAGVNDYISKPVSLRWLVQAIRMHLENIEQQPLSSTQAIS